MYRPIQLLTLAITVTAAAMVTAQQPDLEFTFVEDMQPSKSVLPTGMSADTAGLPVPAADASNSGAIVVAADSTANAAPPVAEATAASIVESAEDEQTETAGTESPQPRFASVDFAQIFETLAEDINFLARPLPYQEKVKPVGAVMEPTLVTQPVELLDKAQAMPEPVEVTEETVVSAPAQACTTCKSTSASACKCRRKPGCMSRLRGWWRNTCVYQMHIQNLGHPGLSERPFGQCHQGWQGAMIATGAAERATLHHYDFAHHADGRVMLTERGRVELVRIADSMAAVPAPLTIETTGDLYLDNARRSAVTAAVAQLGLPISPDSIVMGVDRSMGLSGPDAMSVHAIRTAEAITGASRSRPYPDAAGATVVPLISNDNSGGGQR